MNRSMSYNPLTTVPHVFRLKEGAVGVSVVDGFDFDFIFGHDFTVTGLHESTPSSHLVHLA